MIQDGVLFLFTSSFSSTQSACKNTAIITDLHAIVYQLANCCFYCFVSTCITTTTFIKSQSPLGVGSGVIIITMEVKVKSDEKSRSLT